MDDVKYWNVVKGLGIIAVVVGHSGATITPYLYMYHLAVFFFVAGFLYKDKYSSNPITYSLSRIRRLWWPLVKYGIGFSLLHNIFIKLNIYSEQVLPVKYFDNGMDFLQSIKNTLLMQDLELMGGAMWFIAPLLMGLILFSCIRYLGTKYNGDNCCERIVLFLVAMSYIAGVAILSKGVAVKFRLEIALLITPIIYMGFLSEKTWSKVLIKWYWSLICGLVIVAAYKITNVHIELNEKEIINPVLFLILFFCGIYLHLFISKIVYKSALLTNIVEYIGKNSFHIMALHFLMFKLVSLLYVLVYDKSFFMIAKFPTAYPKWWLLYTLVGILGSLACVEIFKMLAAKSKKIIGSN